MLYCKCLFAKQALQSFGNCSYVSEAVMNFSEALLWLVLILLFFAIASRFPPNKYNAFTEKKANEQETFACAINCMDGRVQEIVRNYMKTAYQVDWVDMITEPGPDRILCECTEKAVVQDIEKRLKISVEHHGTKVVAIVGHEKCAGNPVSKKEHIRQLREDKKTVQAFGLPVQITLLWVPEGWKTVEVIE